MKRKSLRTRIVPVLISLLFITLVTGAFWAVNASTDATVASTYTELKGGKGDVYAVKDINSLERPYNYIIGTTTNPLVEIFGILAALGAIGFGLIHGLGRYVANRKLKKELEEVGSEYIYTGFTRIWHWMNAITIIGLLITGFQMHYAGAEHIDGKVHHFLGYALIIEYLFFLAYGIVTKDIKQFIPAAWEFTEGLIKQGKFYAIGIFKGEEHPYHMVREHRLNPLQKPAYFSIMFGLVPMIIITGLTLMRPDLMSFLINWIGGQENMKYVFYLHLISAFGVLAFLLGHLYLATTGDTVKQHYEVMVTGFHRVYKYHQSK